jgi:hypothetical protein
MRQNSYAGQGNVGNVTYATYAKLARSFRTIYYTWLSLTEAVWLSLTQAACACGLIGENALQ